MTNPIITEMRNSFPERKEFEDAGMCNDDQPWDIIDQAWAWLASIQEPEALSIWDASDIDHATRVFRKLIALDPLSAQ